MYLRRVQAGATIIITDQGKPIGRSVPMKPSLETQVQELNKAGLLAWSGRRLARRTLARTRGRKTVADLLVEDRDASSR